MARAPKPKEEQCIKLSLSFQPDDYKRMIHYCETEERTASWVIRKALREWLDKQGA